MAENPHVGRLVTVNSTLYMDQVNAIEQRVREQHKTRAEVIREVIDAGLRALASEKHT